MQGRSKRVRNAVVVSGIALACALVAARPAGALVINPTFDSTITGAANAAAIENAIDFATSQIAQLYSDPITVNILFRTQAAGASAFLGSSNTGYYFSSLSTFTGLLAADSTANPANSGLGIAVANLGTTDPTGRGIAATSADMRALGVGGDTGCINAAGSFVSGCGQAFDGVITLNTDQPLDYTPPTPTYDGSNTEYDAVRTIEHEVDEILGGGGSGSTLNDIFNSVGGINSGGCTVGVLDSTTNFTCLDGPLDLYRYSAPGTASFTTSGTATSYFSIDDGSTDIVGFNQQSTGDYADFGPNVDACPGGGFGGPAGLIQDAFSCNNETAEAFNTSSPEYTMLEAIGYDPVTVPEPASLLLFGTALVGLGVVRRRLNR